MCACVVLVVFVVVCVFAMGPKRQQTQHQWQMVQEQKPTASRDPSHRIKDAPGLHTPNPGYDVFQTDQH